MGAKIKLKLKMEDIDSSDDLITSMDDRFNRIEGHVNEMKVIQENLNTINTNIEKHRQVAIRLESIKQKLNNKTITPITAKYAMESLAHSIDVHDSELANDTDKAFDESKLDAEVAMEEIEKVEAHAKASGFNLLSGSAIMYTFKYRRYKRAMIELKKLLAETTHLVNTVVMADTPAYEYMPTKKYMEKFLYVGKSLEDGMKSIKTDVCEGLQDQIDSIENYMDGCQNWLYDNAKELFSGKRGLFDSFRVDIKKVTKGFTVFNRSIGYRVPDTDMMFYKGKEMPGGQCIFAEFDPNMGDGYNVADDAISSISKSKFILDISDPKLFYPKRIRYFNSMTDKYLNWGMQLLLNSVGSIPKLFKGEKGGVDKYRFLVAAQIFLVAGAYKVMGRWVVGDTGRENKVVKVDKDLLIKTPSRDQMKKTLKDVEDIIEKVESWRSATASQAFIDQRKLAVLANEFDERDLSAYHSGNHTAAERFLVTLIRKNLDYDCGADMYGIEVCTSLLKMIKDAILLHPLEE